MMFSAWLGGIKPGLLAAALSLLAFHYYFLVPIYPSGMEMEAPRLLVAAMTSLFIVALSAAQRSATAARRESERRYHSLFENMAEGVVYLRMLFEDGEARDAVYLEVNPAWHDLTGLRNVAGRKLSELTPGIRDANPEFFERFGKVAMTGRAERFETYSTPLKRWFAVSAYCPKKDHVIAVLDDITGRKQAEEHRQLVIDTIPTMAWTVRPDGVVEFLNQRWLDYTGLSLEQYLKDPTGPIHPEDIPRVMEKWLAGMAIGAPYEDEMRLRRADGEYRWFLVRTVALRDAQGNIVRWYGTSTDIEDRKQAEDALRDSEERFAAFMDNLPGYAWMKDIQGRYVYINQMVGGLPGYQSIGKTDAQIWPADLAAEYRANDQKVIAAKKPLHTVEHYLHEGKQRYMVGSKFPIFDKDGAVALVGGAGVDITERVEAEEALRDSTVQLQALSRRLVDLQESERRELSRELHDRVGQSLTALKINLDILQPMLASQENDEVAARVADSAALLESTMDTIENVMSELRPPMLDHHGLAPALEWHSRNFSRRTGIAVEVRAGEPLVRPAPQVEIALFRIAQEALNNIAKHADARRVEIVLDHANGDCVMSVQDDGIGFESADDAAGRTKHGLGMITMRERSQAIGGRFEARALPDRGTRITVRVPG